MMQWFVTAGLMELPLPGADGAITSTDAATTVAIDASSDAKKRGHTADDDDRSQKRAKQESLLLQDPAAGCAIAFSGVPASQWRNLPVMDLIYQRNKPKEAPKVPSLAAACAIEGQLMALLTVGVSCVQEPERAPFFLPTLAGVAPVFIPPPKVTDSAPSAAQLPTADAPDGDGDDVWASAWVDDERDVDSDGKGDSEAETAGSGSAVKRRSKGASKLLTSSVSGAVSTPRCVLAQLLLRTTGLGASESTYDAVLSHLAALPAGKVDVEVRRADGLNRECDG